MPIRSHKNYSVLSPASLYRGAQWFIIFTVAGLGVAIWWKTPGNILLFEGEIKWAFAVLLIPLVGIDYLLGGIRFRLFFDGTILPDISLWDCMRSNWANIFMGAVTPFKTGGGPAQIYILWRSGAKISDILLVSLITFSATLFFFIAASIITLYILPGNLFNSSMENVIQGGFIVVGGVSAIIIFFLLFPSTVQALIFYVFRPIPFRFIRLEGLRDRLLKELMYETQRFRNGFARIKKEKRGAILATLMLTLALFFNKFIIGYLIGWALYQGIPFGAFVGLQIITYFLNYFAPTPGASGLEELTSVWLMEAVMPKDILVLFTILLRFFTTILGAFLGCVVLLADFRKQIVRQ